MCFLACQVEAIVSYAKNSIAQDADYETELVGLITSIRAAEAELSEAFAYHRWVEDERAKARAIREGRQ